MDGHQFDRFVRALGTGRSRRSVLKGLAATWLGGAALVKAADGAGATIICIAPYETCNVNDTESTCCPGTTCFNEDSEGIGYCEYDENLCSGEGESCAERYCCSWDQFCNPSQVCEQIDWEATCGGENQFCGYWGKGSYRDCCETFACSSDEGNGVCLPIEPVCIEEGESCGEVVLAQESVCCGTLVCGESGTCEYPAVSCAAEGEACVPPGNDTGLACCENLICLEASATCGTKPKPDPKPGPDPKPVEPVYQLPDTGAGPDGEALNWLAPAALGAAAAVIGSKLIKGEPTEA